MSNKVIIVTGASGFVGKALCRKLVDAGNTIAELDIVNGVNIGDYSHLKGFPKFDIAIHLAARSFVPDSYKMPRDFYETNFMGTLNILELCRENNAKMIYASSYVFGNPQYFPINEQHPVVGFNPYAQSKIFGEELCSAYARDFNLRSVIIRPFNIYGRGQNENFLLPMIINQAKTGTIALKDPRPKRDLLYLDDMIDAYCAAVKYEPKGAEVFNIGYGKSYSIAELVEIVRQESGADIKVEFSNETRPHEILDTVADISKAGKLLKWKPAVSIQDGIKMMMKKR